MVYEEVKLGVYIQDVNGKLWAADEWDGSVDPNGIAVVAEECQFVDAGVSLDGTSNQCGSGSSAGKTEEEAIVDYDGYGNTENYGNTYGLVGAAKEYTFPNGRTGYLPALGEMMVWYNNKTAIEECLSVVTGGASVYASDKLWDDQYIVSTCSSETNWPYMFESINGIGESYHLTSDTISTSCRVFQKL